MQPHRLGDLRPEPLRQPVRTGVAVPVVGARHQLLAADGRREVADIMQQGGGDQGIADPVALG